MSKNLFQAIRSAENKLAKSLSQNINEPINSLLDGDNNTVLHIAANNNNYEMAEYFLNLYDRMIQSDSSRFNEAKKRQWINLKDNQGFCSLHYAVFRGNHLLAFLLEKHGADIYLINTQGLSVLHIAAQGDSPCLMFYYLNKGFKISMKDFKGSTALHWACYSGQQNSVNALLSWGSQIDLQDFTYGMTSLHLAVMSGNGRIVKKLLLKGCDRNIRDYNGKLPIDIARQNQYTNITSMIEDKGGIQQFLNIKSPFRKTSGKTFHFYFFVLLFFANYVLNVGFVILQKAEYIQILGITYLAIGGICVILFFIVSCKNPGYLKPQHNPNFFNVMMRNQPSKLCFDCKIIKPLRSRHCQVCQSCVSVYDHHCPWVGNCIGARNYCYFYAFLVVLIIFMGYTIAFQLFNLVNNVWSSVQTMDIIRSICIIFALIISSFFFIPLSFLVYIQTKNLFTDLTTFQRYSGKNSQNKTQNSNANTYSSNHSLRSSLLNQDRDIQKLQRQQSLNSNTLSMVNQRGISKLNLQVKQKSYCGNCLNMCFENAHNIRYQVGGF